MSIQRPKPDCTPPFTVGINTDNSADPQTATGATNTIQSRGRPTKLTANSHENRTVINFISFFVPGLCLEYMQIAC